MQPQPQPQAVVAPKPTFIHQAARASWMLPIVAAIASNLVRPKSALFADLIMLALIVTGFVLGLMALFGVSRVGRKGVLVPAIIGVILNFGRISLFVKNFMAGAASIQDAIVAYVKAVKDKTFPGPEHTF